MQVALVRPLVSIIITTYYRPAMLREAVSAIRAQTYDNIEIVIVNNGATPETVEYLLELEKVEHRVKLVHFQTNQFSWEDPGLTIRVCFNAGLRASKGDLVFHQEDDDWVAADFVERMVRLFEENPECITAIGQIISAMPDGTLIPYALAKRPRYIPGHELALDYATGGKKIRQINPGHCFVMRRNVLERNGGFHESFEIQQMFAIVPFGITGYDPDALMYWRRHESQLNLIASSRGFDWSQYSERLLSDPLMRVLERWQSQFGIDNSRTVENYFLNKIARERMEVICCQCFNLRFDKALILLLRLRKSDSWNQLGLEIVQDSFELAARRTRLGKMSLQIRFLVKSLATDPVLTLKKINSKIVRKLSK